MLSCCATAVPPVAGVAGAPNNAKGQWMEAQSKILDPHERRVEPGDPGVRSGSFGDLTI